MVAKECKFGSPFCTQDYQEMPQTKEKYLTFEQFQKYIYSIGMDFIRTDYNSALK